MNSCVGTMLAHGKYSIDACVGVKGAELRCRARKTHLVVIRVRFLTDGLKVHLGVPRHLAIGLQFLPEPQVGSVAFRRVLACRITCHRVFCHLQDMLLRLSIVGFLLRN